MQAIISVVENARYVSALRLAHGKKLLTLEEPAVYICCFMGSLALFTELSSL